MERIEQMVDFQRKCKEIVAEYFNKHCKKTDNASIEPVSPERTTVYNKEEETKMKIDSMHKFDGIARTEVARYFNKNRREEDDSIYGDIDVYCVWSCKTLQNFKGLFSTTVPDGMYYEITYDGDKNELYFDAYKKWENRCIELDKY